MNILITHGWSEENSGDYAIEKSIQNVLEEVYPGESKEFAFWSLFSRTDPRMVNHNQFKLSSPGTKVIPSIWGTPPIQYSTLRKYFYVLSRFISNSFLITHFWLQKAFLGRIAFGKNNLAFLEFADLVIVKGGTFLYAPKGLGGIVFTIRIILPIILANFFKKRIIIAPHSFGPYESKLGTSLLFWSLKKATWIFCRENISVEKLKSVGINQVSYCPDMAFMLEPANRLAKGKLDKLTVGMTARPWKYLNHRSSELIYNRYVEELSNFITKSIEAYYNLEFLLIPQVIGPDPREDDSLALNDIKKRLNPVIAKKVSMLRRETRLPEELIKIYSELDLLVGTRMHSVIFALISGVPSIAISYLGPKHLGIMKEFGFERFVTSIDKVEADDLLRKLEEIINGDKSQAIASKSAALKKQIITSFREKLVEHR